MVRNDLSLPLVDAAIDKHMAQLHAWGVRAKSVEEAISMPGVTHFYVPVVRSLAILHATQEAHRDEGSKEALEEAHEYLVHSAKFAARLANLEATRTANEASASVLRVRRPRTVDARFRGLTELGQRAIELASEIRDRFPVLVTNREWLDHVQQTREATAWATMDAVIAYDLFPYESEKTREKEISVLKGMLGKARSYNRGYPEK